ncbi:MAG: hypothetical protein ABJL67_12660 [Sulfitobacter sp.]
MNDKNTPELNSTVASSLVNTALLSALIPKLAERALLTEEDTFGIYDDALLALEKMAANAANEDMRALYGEARKIIEDALSLTPRRNQR